MAKSSYYVPDGSTFGFEYRCSSLHKPCDGSWSDTVGRKFTNSANDYAARFNRPHEKIWEALDPLLEVREDDIEYCSQEYEIRKMWLTK
jgi:hypothetical protein